jgi:hypothetical protein
LEYNLLSLIPSDDVAQANLPQTGNEGENGEDERGEDELPLVESLEQGGLLGVWSVLMQWLMASGARAYLLDQLLLVLGLRGRDDRSLRRGDRSLSEAIANIGAGGDSNLLDSHCSDSFSVFRKKIR